jgi:hypothetical protein
MTLRDQVEIDLEKLVFNTKDLPITCIYTPVTGTGYTIVGYFSNEPVDVDSGSYASISSTAPKFRVQTSKLKSIVKKGDLLTINDVEYNIVKPQPSALTGTTEFYLTRN